MSNRLVQCVKCSHKTTEDHVWWQGCPACGSKDLTYGFIEVKGNHLLPVDAAEYENAECIPPVEQTRLAV